MNRYYTETIPVDLARALKQKGMPIETEGENIWCPSYAEVFDFFWGRHIYIRVEPTRDYREWIACIIDKTCSIIFPTWHEAAEAAITKALELI